MIHKKPLEVHHITTALCHEVCNALEVILDSSTKPFKEYDILKELCTDRFAIFSESEFRDTHRLYQIHFITFHCLYLLQADYLNQKKYHLSINALSIHRTPYQSSHNELPSLEQDTVRNYYLDLYNLFNTSRQDVQQLLNSFWERYLDKASIQRHLKTLEISIKNPEEIRLDEIKRSYKRLVHLYHPDRGGSHEKIVEITGAYSEIKKHLGA